MEELTPIIRWAQNGPKVQLTIDLYNVKEPVIQIEETVLHFKGYGRGAQGENLYNFSLEFFNKIDYKKSFWQCDRNVTIELCKQVVAEEWPRLLKQTQKPGWLKVDFDKWKIDDSDEEREKREVIDNIDKITFEQKVKSDVDKAKDDIIIFTKVAWLTIYNLVQALGYSIIFFKTLACIGYNGIDAHVYIWEAVGGLLITCQMASFVEVLHPVVGVVKTGVTAPLLQVCGRNFVLFALILPNAQFHKDCVLLPLIISWSACEMVRYPFYVATLHRYRNYLLYWLRYSQWLILYPLGMLSEVYFMYFSRGVALDKRIWEYSLPNMLNFSFSLYSFLNLVIISYPPLACYMLMHMWRLRCRKMAGGKKLKTR